MPSNICSVHWPKLQQSELVNPYMPVKVKLASTRATNTKQRILRIALIAVLVCVVLGASVFAYM